MVNCSNRFYANLKRYDSSKPMPTPTNNRLRLPLVLGLVEAIKALDGAFKVLGWIASAAKPILWVAGLIMAAGAVWQTWIKK